MLGIYPGHITCPGERVIDQTCSEDLTGLVIDNLFIERGSDALGYRSMNLSVDDRRVDNTSAIFHDDVAVECHHVCLWVHHQGRDMRRRGRGAPNRII